MVTDLAEFTENGEVNWSKFHMSKLVKDFMNRVEKTADVANWKFLSSDPLFPSLPREFIWKFKDEWDWFTITRAFSQTLSEDFLDEFFQYIHWNYLSYNRFLSEPMIRKYKDQMEWADISSYQDLSHEFIREFKDKLNWNLLYYNDKMNSEYVKIIFKELFNRELNFGPEPIF